MVLTPPAEDNQRSLEALAKAAIDDVGLVDRMGLFARLDDVAVFGTDRDALGVAGGFADDRRRRDAVATEAFRLAHRSDTPHSVRVAFSDSEAES